jgi:hypothetical protein
MGRAQPPRHRRRKKAKLFSAQPDLRSKRSAQESYCSITIILSTNTTPRSGRDLTQDIDGFDPLSMVDGVLRGHTGAAVENLVACGRDHRMSPSW